MTVLVTGASGFIGNQIVKVLRERNRECCALVRQPADSTSQIACDLLRTDTLSDKRIAQGSSVIHCAGLLPVPGRVAYTENVIMTRNLLDALPTSLESLILLSSISVYPLEQEAAVDTDESCNVFTDSAYGASKRQQEELIVAWGRKTGTRTVIFRPSSVYGVAMRPDTILPRLCRQAVQQEDIRLYAPAGYQQNFVSVCDVAEVVVAAVDGDMQGTFNLFSDTTCTARQLADCIVGVSNSQSRIIEAPTNESAPHVRFTNAQLKNTFRPGFRDISREITAICDSIRREQSTGESQ